MSSRTDQKPFLKPASIFFYGASIIIFLLAIRYATKIRDVEHLFGQINGIWLGLAVCSQIATYLFNALIFYNVLGSSRDLPFLTYFKMAIVTVFINQAVPSGGISGGSFIITEANRRGMETKRAFTAWLIEILSFYLASAIAIAFVLISYRLFMHRLPTLFSTVGIIGIVFYTVLAVVVTLASKPKTLALFQRKLRRIRFLERYLEKTISRLTISTDNPWRYFWHHKRQTLALVFYQIGIFAADAFTVFALLQGFGVPSAYYVIFVGFILANIIGTLPLSPGSLIVFEGSMTYVYTVLGVPLQAALIATLLYRALSFWIPMPVGLLLYRALKEEDLSISESRAA